MDGEKSLKRNILEWTALVLVLLGGVAFIFGDALILYVKYFNTEMRFAVNADERFKSSLESRVRSSGTWKCYFAHTPSPGKSKEQIVVTVATKRTLRGRPVNEPGKYNSNGHVDTVLTVREGARIMCTKSVRCNLPAVFTFTSESTGNGQEDVFRDSERKAVEETAGFLKHAAALMSMGHHPEKAAGYLPVVVRHLDDVQGYVVEAAAETLIKFGPRARPAIPEIEKLINKKKYGNRSKRALERALVVLKKRG